jgi:hypothetical protein
MTHTDTNEINRIARRTFRTFICAAGRNRLSTWGARRFRAADGNGLPALRFDVDGLIFSGTVEIAYDRSCDLYNVNLIQENKVISEDKGLNVLFLPVLIEGRVEKPLQVNDTEYRKMINEWKTDYEESDMASDAPAERPAQGQESYHQHDKQ